MATLILEDGSRFEGTLFGHRGPVCGEVVFTTGMSGYQEMMTDPACRGQIVCMTYPLIGNVGINDLDSQSGAAQIAGLIVGELCDLPSNWQLKTPLETYMEEQGVAGLAGVDTRALARHLRKAGVQRGRIVEGEPTQADFDALQAYEMTAPALACTCGEAYEIAGEGGATVAVLDMGMKRSLTAYLNGKGCTLKVYPATTGAQEILDAGCDGVLISDGPGNPKDYPQAVQTVRELMVARPTMGVCLGHLLMAEAAGAKTEKMNHGHHGANQPVKDLARGTCAVTTQHHGYVVSGDALPQGVEISHVNWNDRSVEGLRYGSRAFSVQFTPSGLGGPFDTTYLFDQFMDMMKKEGELNA